MLPRPLCQDLISFQSVNSPLDFLYESLKNCSLPSGMLRSGTLQKICLLEAVLTCWSLPRCLRRQVAVMCCCGVLELPLGELPAGPRGSGCISPFCGFSFLLCSSSSAQRPPLTFPRENWELWLQLIHQAPLHVQCTGVKPIPNVTHSYGETLPLNQEQFPFGKC